MCCRIWGGRSSKGPTAMDLLLLTFMSCSVDDLPIALSLCRSAGWCLVGGWLCPPWNILLPAAVWCIDDGPLDCMFGWMDWCGRDGGASEDARCGGGYCLFPCKCRFLGWSGQSAGTIGSRKSIILFWRVGILFPIPATPKASCGLKVKSIKVELIFLLVSNLLTKYSTVVTD